MDKSCFCFLKDSSPEENTQKCVVLRSGYHPYGDSVLTNNQWVNIRWNGAKQSIPALPDDMWLDQEEYIKQFTPPPLQLKKELLKSIIDEVESAVEDALYDAQHEIKRDAEQRIKELLENESEE